MKFYYIIIVIVSVAPIVALISLKFLFAGEKKNKNKKIQLNQIATNKIQKKTKKNKV